MAQKTKAAMPGRQCNNTKHIQDTRLAADGQSLGAPEITGTAPLARLGGMSKNRDTPYGSTNFSVYLQGTAMAYTPFHYLLQLFIRSPGFFEQSGINRESKIPSLYNNNNNKIPIIIRPTVVLSNSLMNSCPLLFVQSFDSIPRCCNSLRIIRLIQAASDSSPSCCWACSISTRNSGSSLNWNGGLPRLSFLCVDTSITPDVMCLCVMTHYIHVLQIATPRSAGTLPRRLTKPLYEVTIMAELQHTQTHPKFTWLFLATPKSHPDCSPVVLRFDTDTEENARAAFPGWEMVFAAKIRAEAPCRVALFDYNTRRGWDFDSASDREVVGHD